MAWTPNSHGSDMGPMLNDEDIIGQYTPSPGGYASYKDPDMDLSQLDMSQFLNSFHSTAPSTEGRNHYNENRDQLKPPTRLDEDTHIPCNDIGGQLDYCFKNWDALTANGFDLDEMFGGLEKEKSKAPQKTNIHDYMTNTTDDSNSRHSSQSYDNPLTPECSTHEHTSRKMCTGKNRDYRSSPYSVPNKQPVHTIDNACINEPALMEYVDVPADKTLTDGGFPTPLHDPVRNTYIEQSPPQAIAPTLYDSGESDVEVLIQDPVTKNQYSIGIHKLSQALEQYGTPIVKQRATQKTQRQIEDMVKKFCNARDLSFMKQEDAREIVESGREVTTIPLKGKKEDGAFSCMVCPILQQHGRGFDRKEDLKRHYQLHFKFARFMCKHCQYGNSRTDHMKLHIRKCHPEKDEKEYTRT